MKSLFLTTLLTLTLNIPFEAQSELDFNHDAEVIFQSLVFANTTSEVIVVYDLEKESVLATLKALGDCTKIKNPYHDPSSNPYQIDQNEPSVIEIRSSSGYSKALTATDLNFANAFGVILFDSDSEEVVGQKVGNLNCEDWKSHLWQL